MAQVEKNAAIVEKIRGLCKKNNISVTTLEKELSFGNGAIGKWAKAPKAPPYDRIFAIAQYFRVTPEEITGEEKAPTPEGERSIETNPAFFRLKQGLASYDLSENDADFLLEVYKAHVKRNQQVEMLNLYMISVCEIQTIFVTLRKWSWNRKEGAPPGTPSNLFRDFTQMVTSILEATTQS